MKNKIKKQRKNIILLILILLLTLIAILIGITIRKDKKPMQQERTAPYVRPEIKYPINFSEFSEQYSGNFSKDYIIEKITNFIYYIIDNKKEINNLTTDDIEKKYTENQVYLKDLGIENAEDYKNIILQIQKLNSDDLSCSYYEFDFESIDITSETTKVNVKIKFLGIDETIFNIEIKNKYEKDINPICIRVIS